MFLRGRLCFHRGRIESKILEEVESEKFEAEDKVREKFVYTARMGDDMKFVRPSNFGQKTEFVYIKLDATVALNMLNS
jgi:hypothetical protein